MKKKRNKSGTKNGNSGAALTGLDVEILFCVAMGANTNKLLNAKLRKRKQKNIPKSTISRHTTRLQKLRLITATKLFNLREFNLTDHGKLAISNLMTRGQGLSWAVRGHAFGFVCEIVREPRQLRGRLREENWVAFYPKNRVAYKQRLMGCMVVFNPRSVQFIPPEVYAGSQDAAFDQALRLVLKVKALLEDEEFPGLVLGTPQQVARVTGQHYARPFDPLAIEYYRNSLSTGVRSTYRSDRLAIDLSPGLPETETVHRVFSKDDLAKITDFYEKLIRGDTTFDDLENLRLQLPKHFGEVMQRLDVLEKGMISQDKILSHLASSQIVLTGSVDKLVKTFTPKPKPRKRRRKKAVDLHRKPDQRVHEIRRKVEETLAKIQNTEAE